MPRQRASTPVIDIRNRVKELRYVRPSDLADHPQQWRIHGAQQSQAMQGLLREIGIAGALLAYESQATGLTSIDGHLRKSLADTLWPTLILDVTDEEARLLLASYDPISAMAETNRAQLAALLRDVTSGEAGVQALLAQLAEQEGIVPTSWGAGSGPGTVEESDVPVDRAEELREHYGVEVGQLWACGEHRVVCGDCTDKAVVERVMQGALVSLVITDPPYGVSYADKNAFLNTIGPANRIETPIINDHLSKTEMQHLWKAAFSEMARVMAPGAVVYCFMPQGGDQMMMMMMMMEGAGIEPRHELIWLKNNHVLGRVDYAYKHEPILYAWKDGGHRFYGDFQTSILEYPRPQHSDMHPTTKPVALLARLMTNSSQSGEVVYDPFLGSGTTLIACAQLGRVCRGVELSPAYVAVALERYRLLTNTPPTLLEG